MRKTANGHEFKPNMIEKNQSQIDPPSPKKQTGIKSTKLRRDDLLMLPMSKKRRQRAPRSVQFTDYWLPVTGYWLLITDY
ncbi:MAG: hypothetical protein JO025_08485 [Verrucomicrobia bacterium]|nr:hypothetical protein [Verrucomicrobiota bacterium]